MKNPRTAAISREDGMHNGEDPIEITDGKIRLVGRRGLGFSNKAKLYWGWGGGGKQKSGNLEG